MNFRKCVLLPGWRFSKRNVISLLRDHAPKWSVFLVLTASLYLGIGIGPSGHLLSWDRAITRFEARFVYIRSLGLGLGASILLYNVLAVSVIQFVAQIRPVPSALLDLERRLLPRLIPARGNWVSVDILHRIGQFIPLKCAPYSVAHICSAVAIRYAAGSPLDGLHLQNIRETLEDHGLLTHPLPHWHTHDPGDFIWHNGRLLRPFKPLLEECGSVSSQTLIYRQLLNGYIPIVYRGSFALYTVAKRREDQPVFSARNYLIHRFGRFFSPHAACTAADAAIVTAFMLEGLPPKVLSVVFKLWLNAWPVHSDHMTAHSCCLCRDPMSVASGVHLFKCSAVRRAFYATELLPPSHLHAFLLLSRAPRSIVRRRAVTLFLVHKVLCFCRHNPHHQFDNVLRGYIIRYKALIRMR